ncbi:MAG: hypothetical protein B5766_09460 [Candidatus Lumbricidophila eiseniae]|uniref:Xylose isomerase-like TIM barrel domain-containing protein n=1 Tax=Candidatus Lumbricidiphila eiseniae TaxID=1969409 RepID=A0A2A6FQ47_9MICO|nr:MAG: hypothetical protein B5766_09460 [Candidatus Lumbricidophila eiseniae]
MNVLAANMEWLFTEAGESTANRIRAAAKHGLRSVEIWGWRDKDLGAIEGALRDTGVQLLSLIVEPQLNITDPAIRERYLTGVRESLNIAVQLGAPYLVVVAGDEMAGVSRTTQHDSVVDTLRGAVKILEQSGVTLLLEPLNTKVDHIGTYLWSTREGLDIVREVGSPHLKLLLDAYHALVMGEHFEEVIGEDIALIGHVQVADIPGRHEPGTGKIDWAQQLGILRGLGYTGSFGMEYMPTVETGQSLVAVTAMVNGLV